MSNTLPNGRRLLLALDPITDPEQQVYQALLFHLSEAELATLAHMVEQARRDRWPS